MHSVRRDDRQGLHRDFDPTGQDGKDFRNSCDRWCNIGIYLRDQTPEEGPLWVVPGSHKLPRDIGRAGLDFNEYYAPQARRICCSAGDAVIFDCLTIHAGGKHVQRDRPGCFHSYRSAETVTNDYYRFSLVVLTGRSWKGKRVSKLVATIVNFRITIQLLLV